MCKSTGFSGTARYLTLLLAVLLLLPALLSLTACGEVHDEAERAALVARAAELLPAAVAIDDLLYVTGVPLKAGESTTSGYADADMEALAALGFSSVADIKAKMRGIWTERYVSGVERSAIFSSVAADGQMASYAYVTDAYDKGTDTYLGVRVKTPRDEVLHMDVSDYDLTSIAYVSGLKKSVTLSVRVRVTNAAGEVQEKLRELKLALAEDGVWRLDNGTYNKYSDAKNR